MNSRILALALVVGAATACSGSSNNTISPIVTSTTTPTEPTSGTLAFTLSTTTLTEGQTIPLSATGGAPPYTYCIGNNDSDCSYVPDMGSINTISENPTYTAPDNAASVTLVVIDSLGYEATVTLTVTGSSTGGNNPAPLLMSPSSGTYVTGQAITLTTTGGTPPYTYSISGGSGGSFGNQSTNQVIFNAPSSPGSVSIQVTDANSLVSTTNLTFVQPSGLMITPANGSVGTGQTAVFEAFGGTGPYVFSVAGGLGSFSGETYFASAVPATATITVTDEGTGKTASTSIAVSATYSTEQMSSVFQIEVGRYAAITYDDDPSAGPSFEVFGTGNTNATGLGYDANGYIIYNQYEVNVPLTNYGTGAPVTYRGTIEIQGQSASETVSYCIPPTNNTLAYLNQAPNKNQLYAQVAFDGNNTLFNGDLTETFFTNVNSEKYAGYAVVNFLGGFTNNANCSDFNSSYSVTVTN